MAIHKYLRASFGSAESKELLRKRMIEWRKEDSTVRLERPTRVDRARSIGYKAKQGFIAVRQRVKRGGRMRPKIRMGRRPKAYRHKMIHKQSYQVVAEQRAAKKFPNLTVLNSYKVGKDQHYYYYEVIFVDPAHPNIQKDTGLANLSKQKGRVERGLTSAGRKSRGLRNKGKGAEKVRPGLNANDGRGN